METICSVYPDINPEWLLTGKGKMLKSAETAPPQAQAEPPPSCTTCVAHKERIADLKEEIAQKNEQIAQKDEQIMALIKQNTGSDIDLTTLPPKGGRFYPKP